MPIREPILSCCLNFKADDVLVASRDRHRKVHTEREREAEVRTTSNRELPARQDMQEHWQDAPVHASTSSAASVTEDGCVQANGCFSLEFSTAGLVRVICA